MPSLFNRWLPCATLTLWSLVLLYFSHAQGALLRWASTWTHLFTGRIDPYLIPTFRPLVLVAGFILLGMALLFLLVPVDAACCQADDCAHPLSRKAGGKWLSFLVLVVPLAAVARVSPDSFSANTLRNRETVTDSSALPTRVVKSVPPAAAPVASMATPLTLPLPTQSGSPAPAALAAAAADPKDYLVRTPEGYIQTEVLDLIYAAQDAALRKDFDGKTVELIGQMMPDTAKPGGMRFKAVRMLMTCCAADARPVATAIEAKTACKIPEMSWIKIVGKATFPVENGRRTAVLQAETVEKTEPPPETMLY